MDWTKVAIEEGLCAKTPECPEGLQYVLIRGLHAMGFQQATAETWELLRAALDAAVKAQGLSFTTDETVLAIQKAHTVGRAEALEEAAKVAKVAWLTSDTGTIGDADYGNALCEEIAGHIRALKDKPKEKINPDSKIF